MASSAAALPGRARKHSRSSVQRHRSLAISSPDHSGPARMTLADPGRRCPPMHGTSSDVSDAADVCLVGTALLAARRTALRLKPRLREVRTALKVSLSRSSPSPGARTFHNRDLFIMADLGLTAGRWRRSHRPHARRISAGRRRDLLDCRRRMRFNPRRRAAMAAQPSWGCVSWKLFRACIPVHQSAKPSISSRPGISGVNET